MNPMTNVKNIKKLSDLELRRNLKTSWHDQYKGSAWVFIGGLPYDLSEGDIICVFSQYGEIVNINLVRDKATGNSRGFGFLCYEDQRSTVLAVDNFNGIKLLGRTLRVDHVQDYKPPKDSEKKDTETRRLQEEGCAPTSSFASIKKESTLKKEKPDDDIMIIEKAPSVVDLANGRTAKEIKSEPKSKKKKKEKKSSKEKEKKEKESDKKKKRKTRKRSSSPSSSSDDSSSSSSDSSSESSSAESDSSEERARIKKRKHKQTKKKKLRRQEDESRESESSASSKRRKLEEKIKALERALNSVRSGRNKQE